MKIKKDFIDKLIQNVSIVDLISSYSKLSKNGKNYTGLCPFHNEDTPSFYVDSEKKLFHCFGCKKSGNPIQFVQEKENLGFVEACEFLAERIGLEIEYDGVITEKELRKKKYFELASKAAQIFTSKLKKNHKALNYLKARKINSEMIKKFEIGFSDGSLGDNFSDEEKKLLSEIGLLKEKNSDFTESFYLRIIFPLKDKYGRVCGFAGRAIDENDKVKYLNSPNSILYDKSKMIYGIEKAKKFINSNDFSILTEGYFDCIRLHEQGFSNAVAVSGTKVSDYQLNDLKSFSPNIVLLFDGDNAGREANMLLCEKAARKDLNIRVATLPENMDPDSFFKEKKHGDFVELLKKAPFYIDYVINEYYKNSDNLYRKGENFKKAELFGENIINPVIKKEYYEKIEEKFGIKVNYVEKIKKKENKPDKKFVNEKPLETDIFTHLNSKLLKISLNSYEIVDFIYKNYYKFIDDLFLKNIIFNLHLKKSAADLLSLDISSDYRNIIARHNFEENSDFENSVDLKHEVEHIFKIIQSEKIKNEISELEELLKTIKDDDKDYEKISYKYFNLIKDFKKLS
ncbi:MAG: DNA primase [Candidatus Muiribacteriota bacterium]